MQKWDIQGGHINSQGKFSSAWKTASYLTLNSSLDISWSLVSNIFRNDSTLKSIFLGPCQVFSKINNISRKTINYDQEARRYTIAVDWIINCTPRTPKSFLHSC